MTRKRRYSVGFDLALAACLGSALCGCRLTDTAKSAECSLSLQVDDSLYAFDTVSIELVDPSTHSVRKTVWHAPLGSAAPLQNIASGEYCGEPVDVAITALQKDSSRPYRRLIHFQGASGKTISEALPPIPAPGGGRPEDLAGLPRILFTTKDASVDTTSGVNNGYTAVFPLATQTGSDKLFVFKFDLARIRADRLKSGKLRFKVFATGTGSKPITDSVICRIYGIRADWVEGTGNWHYHDGGWRNSGQELFGGYAMPDSIRKLSSNPAILTGINRADTEMLRLSSATLLTTETVPLILPSVRVSTVLPARSGLGELSIDMTDYLRTVRPGEDFGWMMTVDRVPAGIALGTLSKEIDDGTLGPSLILDY